MIINKKSWHYMLVEQFYKSALYFPEDLDSCSYINMTIKSILLSLGVTFFLVVIIDFMVLSPIIWLIVSYNVGFFVNVMILLAFGLWAVFGVAAGGVWLENNRQGKLMPSFITQAHDRIKNKYCSKLEVID